MKLKLFSLSLIFCAGLMAAQTYQVPVTEDDEPMMQGQFRPTWESLSSYQVPEWFRNISLFLFQSRSLRAKLTLVLFEYAADIEVKPASIANEVINLNVIVTWGLKLVGFGNDT